MSKKTINALSKKGLIKGKILGVQVNSNSLKELLKDILRKQISGLGSTVVTPNPEFMVEAAKNPAFLNRLNQADFAIPDGIGLVWAGRWLGKKIPERITGTDLAAQLLVEANRRGWRVGLIGARRGNETERRQLTDRLKLRFARVKFSHLEEVADWAKTSWPLVFACQGMGEQEKWLATHRTDLKGTIAVGIGGGLDMLAGLVPRAPNWIRQVGLEWLYRLLRQPWRWRRQVKLLTFVWLVIREKFKFKG